MLFLGCNGGTSKTEFILADDKGGILSHRIYPAFRYGGVGDDTFRRSMHDALHEVLNEAGVKPGEVSFSVFGLAAYGEAEGMEKAVQVALGEIFLQEHTAIVNDAVISGSGSLPGSPEMTESAKPEYPPLVRALAIAAGKYLPADFLQSMLSKIHRTLNQSMSINF